MALSAIIFIAVGIVLIGFGLMSLSNIFNMPYTDHQEEHADITNTSHQRKLAKVTLTGLIMIAIGVGLALLTEI
ncbi:MAG: hypothetical protein AAF563_05225 [Pseudomonadota bacterium]